MASASSIASSITSVWGANDEESTVDTFLDTGLPELNFALASDWGVDPGKGGLPVGRMVEIAGPPSAGKTAISTAAMASAQNMGGIAIFMDHERSFSLRLAPKLGLDVTPGRFLFKKPRTFEESLALVVAVAKHIRDQKLIPAAAPICAVFDSLASMVPKSALLDKNGKERTAEDRNMNDNTALARATSAHLPAFAQHCEELGICAVFLNQTRTLIGVMYGDPTTTPGGNSPKFYFSIRIMLSSSKIVDEKTKQVLGASVTGKCIKNKIVRPFMEATWRFMFQADGTGKFDKVRSTIEFLIREKVLTNPGGRIEWIDGKKYFIGQLTEKIETEGLWKDLCKLLPVKYEPEVVAVIEPEMEDEAA